MRHDLRLFFHILALELADPPIEEMAAREREEARKGFSKPRPVDVEEVIRKSEIKIDEAAILEKFRPVKQVGEFAREAKFDKVALSPHGRTVGYFSFICVDRKARQSFRYCWRYRVEDGFPVLDHEFPVSVRPLQERGR